MDPSRVSGDALPSLLQMVSAVIQEDQYEVSLTISFVSAGREGKQVRPGLCLTGSPGFCLTDNVSGFRWMLNVMLQVQQGSVLDQ